jgi:hypothetical protein
MAADEVEAAQLMSRDASAVERADHELHRRSILREQERKLGTREWSRKAANAAKELLARLSVPGVPALPSEVTEHLAELVRVQDDKGSSGPLDAEVLAARFPRADSDSLGYWRGKLAEIYRVVAQQEAARLEEDVKKWKLMTELPEREPYFNQRALENMMGILRPWVGSLRSARALLRQTLERAARASEDPRRIRKMLELMDHHEEEEEGEGGQKKPRHVECFVCSAPALARCGDCLAAAYCGRQCQLADYARGHRRACLLT